jgi:hypothetical protein
MEKTGELSEVFLQLLLGIKLLVDALLEIVEEHIEIFVPTSWLLVKATYE